MENKKKPILIGAILVCLVLAAIITFATNKPSGGKRKLKGTTLIKCRSCKAVYEMEAEDYRDQVVASGSARINCNECGKKTAVAVMKCEKCGNVFRKGAAGEGEGVFSDQCPKCDYSKTAERRKAR